MSERMRWTSMESAPNDGTAILAYALGADHRPLIAIVRWACATHRFSSHRICRPAQPQDDCDYRWLGSMATRYGVEFTHWMSVPAPPITDDDEPADGTWFRTLGAWRPMQPASGNNLVIGDSVPCPGLVNMVLYPLSIEFPRRHHGEVPVWQISIYGVDRNCNSAPTRSSIRELCRALGVGCKETL